MQVSIQRKDGEDKGVYPILGFLGGGVIILDKDKNFQHVGFDHITRDWVVSGDTDKKPASAPAKSPAPIEVVEPLT